MNQCNDPDHGAINAERAESRGLRKAWVELDDKRQDLEKQLSAITEQRDRLAEAIRKHRDELKLTSGDSVDRILWNVLDAVEGGSDE
jgi:chromosome segregation ATPase